MNRCLRALVLFSIAGRALAAAEAKFGTAEDLPVQQTELSLPPPTPAEETAASISESPRQKFLWDHFFNIKGELSFTNITTETWRPQAAEFQRTMVAKAKGLGLPYEALDKAICAALSSPANEKLAVIPVGAYLLLDSGRPAWAIVCNWEHDGPTYRVDIPTLGGKAPNPADKREPSWEAIAHRRVFVYAVESGEWLAYTSCD